MTRLGVSLAEPYAPLKGDTRIPMFLVQPYVCAQEFSFFLSQYVQVIFYPLLQQFSHQGGTI